MQYYFISVLFLFFTSNYAHAYIDPGSGSAIISLIIASMVLIGVFLKTFWYKLKSLFGFKSNNIILMDQSNTLEIDIEGTNSERHLGISGDLRKLGLALVELSLR